DYAETTTRSRPAFLARYSAAPAACTSASPVGRGAGYAATPAEIVTEATDRPRCAKKGGVTAPRLRSARRRVMWLAAAGGVSEDALSGHGGGEPVLRLGRLGGVHAGTEIKDAERFALRNEGNAEIRRRHRLRQVAAEKPGRRGVHEMHAAAPEGPALLGLED